MGEVEVAGGLGGPAHDGADGIEIGFGEGVEEFELFGEAADGPGEATGPGGEGGVALLRTGTAEAAVVAIEDGFVDGASAEVVGVAAFAVIDAVVGGGGGVFDEAVEQGDAAIVFGGEDMTEAMGDGEGAEGADGVDEEGMGTIEGVDVAAAAVDGGPAGGLDGAAGLECELVEVFFPGVGGDAAFGEEAEEIAVGGDVVEAMVMDAGVGDVGGHELKGVGAADREELFVAGGIELEDGGAELEALGPFSPAAARVEAIDGEDGRAFLWGPGGFELEDLLR